jgi:predicted phosphoribosyltransferase
VLTLLQSAEIGLPREPDALAAITPGGAMSYNHSFSDGELDEMTSEYFGLIEQEKLLKMHELNHLVGSGGTLNKAFLKDHTVIVVSDGLKTGFAVDLAAEFLKPIAIDKFIIATPFAGVKAVDRMHVLADELYCLNVIADYLDTDHYYDKRDVPDHQTVLDTVEHIMLNWQ